MHRRECVPAHALLTSQYGVRESPMVTGPTNTSGLGEIGPKTGGPLPAGLGGFSLWGSRHGGQRLSEHGSFADRHQPKVFEGKR